VEKGGKWVALAWAHPRSAKGREKAPYGGKVPKGFCSKRESKEKKKFQALWRSEKRSF